MGQPSPEAVQNLTRDLLSRSTSRPDASAAAGDAGYAWICYSYICIDLNTIHTISTVH